MEQNTYATVTTYNFAPHSEIRVIQKHDSVWFSIEDICKATGIIPSHVLKDIDPTHKGIFITYNGQENIETAIDMISFDRLKMVVAGSNMVRARAFLQWVETEIMGMEDGQDDLIELTDDVGHEDCSIDMRTFNFKNSEDHKVRAIIREDGSIWFVGKDVAEVLGYTDTNQAIRKHCKYSELFKPVELTGLTTSPRGITIIPESDLYRLIMRSRLPAAERFEEWVVGEVLPQIRKTGAYMPGQPTTGQEFPGATAAPDSHPAQDHLDQVGARATTLTPGISPKAITAFLQAATDTFWEVDKALNEYKAMEASLKKAKKDVAIIIRSAKQAFPEAAESINLLGGHVGGMETKLDVEMR